MLKEMDVKIFGVRKLYLSSLQLSLRRVSRQPHLSSPRHQNFNLSIIASITMGNYTGKTYNLFVYSSPSLTVSVLQVP